ncbi:MAG: response regulator [Spirochaetales bacterium]|nr:response regulator [Spirochaetales bacterium]
MKTVLIVEDESIAALELSETVRSLGYRVPEPVDSADKVMAALVREQPDAIFMDIHLSSFIDGIDAARRMKLLRDIPLVYLTAYNNEETRRRAEKTDPVDFLVKPVSRSQIESVLKQIFTSH